MKQDICIALASASFVNGQREENLRTMLAFMEEASAKGADLICFGESFLQGFDGLCWDYAADRDMAVTQDSGEIRRIRKASLQLGIDVMFGYIEREDESLYSSCMLVEKGEITHNYRRMSRGWKEYERTDDHYCEGTAATVFDYRGWKCVITLCGDLWDTTRDAFRLGEDILFWPLYCDYTREEWLDGALREYAQQCRDHAPLTLMINSIAEGESVGGCAVYSRGEVAQLLHPGETGILCLHPLYIH